MSRIHAGKQEIDAFGRKAVIDVYENPELTRNVSYALKGYTALAFRGEGEHFPTGTRIEVLEGEIPFMRRTPKGSYFDATTIPSEGEDYRIVVDERLSPQEKLAKIFHELGHISGGYKTSDKQAHAIAMRTAKNLAEHYDGWKKKGSLFKRNYGVDFKVSEVSRPDLLQALQYLIDTGETFGVGREERRQIGFQEVQNPRTEPSRLEKSLSVFLVSSLIIGFLFSSGITGFSIFEGLSDNSYAIPAIFIILLTLLWFLIVIKPFREKVR